MAVIRTSAIVGAISGNVGGINFVNSGKGQIARQVKRQPNQQSQRQLEQRSRIGAATAKWQSYSDEVRDAWRLLASQVPGTNRVGVTRTPSGWQLFLGLALHLRPVEMDLLDNIPIAVREAPRTNMTFTVQVGANIALISWSNTLVGLGWKRLTWASNPHRISRPKFFRDFVALPFDLTGVTAINIWDEFVAELGVPQVGGVVAARIAIWGLGRLAISQPLPAVFTQASTVVLP